MTRDEELREPFHTTEPLKAAAKRLRIDPVRLRALWNEVFGEGAMAERGKRIRAASATEVAKAIAVNRVFSDVEVPCTACGLRVSMKSNAAAQLDRAVFRCEQCSGDRDCPVCGQRVDGERGMSAHFRHRREAGDVEHPAYERGEIDALWVGKVEPLDYVTCRECGLRSTNLTSHIQVHGVVADEYRRRHGGARLRSEREQEVLNQGTARSHVEGKHDGTKKVVCPDCDEEWDAPKSLALSVHDTRCLLCRELTMQAEEEARWEGKTEPEDYVTCRVCGSYRGQNLTSHFRSVHPEVVGRYGVLHPGALVMTPGSPQRIANNRINLTPADLTPYMDGKGRVEVAKAADGLGCVHWTVLRYCRQYKLPTRNRLAFQKRVLDLVSEALGGAGYVWEWSHAGIRNPKTGYQLYFDGLFAKHGLLVEAHGAQHFKYIPYWHKSEAEFEARRELDVLKVRAAEALGYKVLVIRHDEPFTDPMYLAGRLVQMGVLQPHLVPSAVEEPGGAGWRRARPVAG